MPCDVGDDMFCTNCGKELQPGARFCTACGLPVPDAGPVPPAAADEASSTVQRPAVTASAADLEARSAQESPAAPVPPAPSDTGASGGPAGAPSPSGNAGGKRRNLVIGLAIAAAVVVIAVVAGTFLLGGKSTVYRFGQDEAVSTSLVTRVNPQTEDGKLMTAFEAWLVRTGDAEGKDGDRSEYESLYGRDTTPYHIRVTGNAGFTMGDFGDDIPEGRYNVFIQNETDGDDPKDTEDNDASDDSGKDSADDSSDKDAPADDTASDDDSDTQHFPVDFKPENPDAEDVVTVAPPEPGDDGAVDEVTKAYRAYYDKLTGYIEKYGEPGSESHHDGQTILATGVTVAKLIDFDGDGNEELLVAYNTNKGLSDQEVTSQKALDGFKVEVWSYRDGKVEVVYDEPNTVMHSNGGYAWLQVMEQNDVPLLETYAYGEDDSGKTTETATYRRFGDGEFQTVLETKLTYSYDDLPNMTRTVDGAKVDEGAFDKATADIHVSEQFSMIEWPGTSPAEDGRTTYTIEGNTKLTNDTLATLKAKAEGEDAKKDDSDKKDGFEEAQSVGFVAKDVVKDLTITSYQVGAGSYDKQSRWAYPQFAPEKGEPSKELQNLNSGFKQDYEDALSKQRNMTPEQAEGDMDGAAEQILWRYDTTTNITGDIASVRLDRYSFYGGAHGTRYVSGRFYNLSTGKEVPATEALGMSEDEIEQAASSALSEFLANTPSDLPEYLDTGRAVSDLFQPDRTFIYRTDDAVVACFTEGTLGSIGFGGHEIVIKALTDKVQVGDDLVGNYKQP